MTDVALFISSSGMTLARTGVVDQATVGFELWLGGKYLEELGAERISDWALGGINRLVSVTPTAPFKSWTSMINSEVPLGVNFDPEWAITDVDTAFIYSGTAGGGGAYYICSVEGRRMTALPNEVYQASGLFAAHRCAGKLQISFYDEKGALTTTDFADVPSGYEGGTQTSGYSRVNVAARAPSDARSMSVEVIKDSTAFGDDSFLFFANVALHRGASPSEAAASTLNFAQDAVIEIFKTPRAKLDFFRVRLPPYARKGESPVFIVDRASGVKLALDDIDTSEPAAPKVEIFGLEGSVVLGRVSSLPLGRNSLLIDLSIDRTPVGFQFFSDVAPDHFLRFPLPLSACDGQPHLFELHDRASGQLLGNFADIGPSSLTPWSALQRFAGTPLPIGRSPAMQHRYRALRDGLNDLLASAAKGGEASIPLADEIRQLTLSHDAVVAGFDDKRQKREQLVFDPVEAPVVSIVIPVHNKFEVTYNCLASLRLAPSAASFEVIIVDDGSTDATLNLDDFAKNIKYVRNETALGFVGACNRGAKEAVGRYIAFLNNDTEVTPNWLDELLFIIEGFDDVGLVGAKLLYGDGRLQEAGGIVWETGDPWNFGRGDNPASTKFCYTREVDYVSGAALLLPRPLWETLGGFSEEFAPAYFEDTDLAFKVKSVGKRVVFAPFSIVYHFEGLSNGTDTSSSGLKRFQEINRPKFKRKWSRLFKGNGKVGVEPELAKDRGISRRVLFLDIETPRLDNDAGSYAALQEMRLLQALGFKVTFAPANMAYVGRHTELLQRLGVEVLYAPSFESIEQVIEKRITEFDLVYITRHQVVERVADLVRSKRSDVPIVCNIADLHFLRAIRQSIVGSPANQDYSEIERMRDEELNALAKTDLVLTYSEIERGVLETHRIGQLKVALLPWVLDHPAEVIPFHKRDGLAFLGGFGHPPNVSAVEFFVLEVMPLLRERLKDVKFRIYGTSMPDHLLKYAADDVIFIGYVSDVRQVFDSCRVFVAPLRYGAGVKGKVLDSIAAGVPSVLSPAAAEALPLTPGSDALIANERTEWVEAIVSLYENEAKWSEMSRNVRNLAQNTFSFERGVGIMKAALEKVNIYTDGDMSALCVKSARPSAPWQSTQVATRPAKAEPKVSAPRASRKVGTRPDSL